MDGVVSSHNDFQGLAKLRAKAQEDQMSAAREVGQQFEAFFIQMMLKSMRDAGEGLKSGLWSRAQETAMKRCLTRSCRLRSPSLKA